MDSIDDFGKFYTLYYRKSFLFAKSYVHDDPAAEDIASDSLIKLWEKLKEEEVSIPQALLLTILKNKSLDYLKHRIIRENIHHSMSQWQERELDIRISTLKAFDPEEIFTSEIMDLMKRTLNSLPEQTQKIFWLSRIECKSNKEIALETGMTVKGVEYHISRAIKVLRISLKDYILLLSFLIWQKPA